MTAIRESYTRLDIDGDGCVRPEEAYKGAVAVFEAEQGILCQFIYLVSSCGVRLLLKWTRSRW